MSMGRLLMLFLLLVVALGGIGYTLQKEQDRDSQGGPSGLENVDLSLKTDEEKYLAVLQMPKELESEEVVKQIEILSSKIELAEELVSAGGPYADGATVRLVQLYGLRCNLECLEGLSSAKSFTRLARLREEFVATGREDYLIQVDYARLLPAINMLYRNAEETDFRFAADNILAIDAEKLVEFKKIYNIASAAINLYEGSSQQDNAAVLISMLADKLKESPKRKIAELGLKMKDFRNYFRFYDAVDSQKYTRRESKLQLLRELFEQLEQDPPESVKTFAVVIRLIDVLLNPTDAKYAEELTDRLEKAASGGSHETKQFVDKAIQQIKMRVAAVGRTLDLSGSNHVGRPLKLPNEKPTMLVFWQQDDKRSSLYLRTVGMSDRFDPWANNLLFACVSDLSKEKFKITANNFKNLTFLDNETANRMKMDLGIDQVPYLVTIDKDGKVLKFGEPVQ